MNAMIASLCVLQCPTPSGRPYQLQHLFGIQESISVQIVGLYMSSPGFQKEKGKKENSFRIHSVQQKFSNDRARTPHTGFSYLPDGIELLLGQMRVLATYILVLKHILCDRASADTHDRERRPPERERLL